MIHRQKRLKPVAHRMAGIMGTASFNDTLSDLKRRGYRFKFRREGTWLYCVELDRWFTPDSFIIEEYYHFDAGSGTCGDQMLYAIASFQGFKGYLTNICFALGVNAGVEVAEKPDWEYLYGLF